MNQNIDLHGGPHTGDIRPGRDVRLRDRAQGRLPRGPLETVPAPPPTLDRRQHRTALCTLAGSRSGGKSVGPRSLATSRWPVAALVLYSLGVDLTELDGDNSNNGKREPQKISFLEVWPDTIKQEFELEFISQVSRMESTIRGDTGCLGLEVYLLQIATDSVSRGGLAGLVLRKVEESLVPQPPTSSLSSLTTRYSRVGFFQTNKADAEGFLQTNKADAEGYFARMRRG